MTREDVMQALFGLVTAGGAFATAGRRLLMANQVAEQPAVFVRNAGEHWERSHTRMPPKVTMEIEIWLYSRGGADPSMPPAVALNVLIDTVGRALSAFPGDAQTLGGLVTHAWIEGAVELWPGDLDGQAIAIVPVKILVPTFGG
jgi:hypothetical protein